MTRHAKQGGVAAEDGRVEVEHNRIAHPELVDECAHRFVPVADVDPDHHQAVSGMCLGQPLHGRHLGSARHAARRPEVEPHDPPSQAFEVDRRSPEDRRRLAVDAQGRRVAADQAARPGRSGPTHRQQRQEYHRRHGEGSEHK